MVALPAEFVQKLKNQEGNEGESITLRCEFSKPGAKAQWKKGSHVLTSGDRHIIKQTDKTFELKISNTKPEDSGDYICECGDQKTRASIKVHGRKAPLCSLFFSAKRNSCPVFYSFEILLFLLICCT